MLTGLGVGCFTTIVCTVLVHLTLIPSISLVCAAINETCIMLKRKWWNKDGGGYSSIGLESTLARVENESRGAALKSQSKSQKEKIIELRRIHKTSETDEAAVWDHLSRSTSTGKISPTISEGEISPSYSEEAETEDYSLGGGYDAEDAIPTFNDEFESQSNDLLHRSNGGGGARAYSDSAGLYSSLSSPNPKDSALDKILVPKSLWIDWGLLVAKYPRVILSIAFVISIPIIYQSLRPNSPFLNMSYGMNHLLPADAQPVFDAKQLNTKFGHPSGLLAPHGLMVCTRRIESDPPPSRNPDIPHTFDLDRGVVSGVFFDAVKDLIFNILSNSDEETGLGFWATPTTSIESHVLQGGVFMDDVEAKVLLSIGRKHFNVPENGTIWTNDNLSAMFESVVVTDPDSPPADLLDRAVSYAVAAERLVSMDLRCAKIVVTTSDHNIFDDRSAFWIEKVRALTGEGTGRKDIIPSIDRKLKASSASTTTWQDRWPDHEVMLYDQAAKQYDGVSAVFKVDRPLIFLIALVSLWILSTIFFRTPVLAFRLLLTSIYTILLSFGLIGFVFGQNAILIFESKPMWTNIDTLGFYWIINITMVIIIAGLTLDYGRLTFPDSRNTNLCLSFSNLSFSLSRSLHSNRFIPHHESYRVQGQQV
jgi:hypothetical protein